MSPWFITVQWWLDMFCVVTSTVITNRLVQSSEISSCSSWPLQGCLNTQNIISNWTDQFHEVGNSERKFFFGFFWISSSVALQQALTNYKSDTDNYFTISPLEMTNSFSRQHLCFIVHLHVTSYQIVWTIFYKRLFNLVEKRWVMILVYYFETKFVIFTF